MGAVTVNRVEGRRGRSEFIGMPWLVYRDDRHWVPPLISDQKRFLDPRKGVFYRHGEAALFLARRDGRAVGRISAHLNHLHEERFRDGRGFFGFFECENDPQTAGALFEAAEGYLRSRGRSVAEGPLSFGIYDEVGILVNGFDSDPFVMNIHNPPYYPELIEGCGYRKAVDWLAYHGYTRDYEILEPRLFRLRDRVMSRSGLAFRAIRMRDLEQEARIVLAIFNAAWDKNWGHIPITEGQFERLKEALKMIVVPELSLIAEEEDGTPVGMALTLYDANEAVKKIGGRLFPFGFLTFLREVRRSRRFRQFAMGVLEKYRGRGIEIAFFMTIARRALELGFREGEMSLIVETNEPMVRTMEYLPVEPYKTYRIYRKEL